jgi:hypothetical protein
VSYTVVLDYTSKVFRRILARPMRENVTISGLRISQITNAFGMIERCNSKIRAISYSLHPPLLAVC